MPPPGLAVAVPVFDVHAVFVELAEPLKAVAGCVIVTVDIAEQLFPSFIVTVYVAAINPEMEDAVDVVLQL